MNRKAGEKRKALYKIRRWVMRLPMADLPPLRPPMTDCQLTVLARLREAFAKLPDISQPGKVLHCLDEVLLCAFFSMLFDGDSFTDMEDFA